jgi:hypothetical protein
LIKARAAPKRRAKRSEAKDFMVKLCHMLECEFVREERTLLQDLRDEVIKSCAGTS